MPKTGVDNAVEVLPELVGYVGGRGGRKRRRHLINYSKLLGENTDSDSGEREGREGRRSVFAVARTGAEIWTDGVRGRKRRE